MKVYDQLLAAGYDFELNPNYVKRASEEVSAAVSSTLTELVKLADKATLWQSAVLRA